jgi:hypothetical protein
MKVYKRRNNFKVSVGEICGKAILEPVSIFLEGSIIQNCFYLITTAVLNA